MWILWMEYRRIFPGRAFACSQNPKRILPMATCSSSSSISQAFPSRISDVVKPWATAAPESVALVEASGSWTYAQLYSAISATQTWLGESGIRPGDRVMIVGENCREFVVLLLASAAIDAWPVLVNARVSPREIDEIRNHCGARRLLFTTSVSPAAVDHARRDQATLEEVAGLGSIAVGALNESVKAEVVDDVGANVADRVAALIYTSGTTGLPKGVMLTHRNLLFLAAGSAKIRSLSPNDRLYGILPMSHAVGLSVVLLGSLLSGATLYLAWRFDPVAALGSLEKDKLTVVLGAPSMFSLLADYAKLKNLK